MELKSGVDSGKQVTLEVETSFSHALQAYPSQITQAEKQLVRFAANLYLFSTYLVKSQTLIINTPSSAIQSYTKIQPVKVSDNTITYGPYENVEPFTQVSSQS